jgi:hypothetical protein
LTNSQWLNYQPFNQAALASLIFSRAMEYRMARRPSSKRTATKLSSHDDEAQTAVPLDAHRSAPRFLPLIRNDFARRNMASFSLDDQK